MLQLKQELGRLNRIYIQRMSEHPIDKENLRRLQDATNALELRIKNGSV